MLVLQEDLSPQIVLKRVFTLRFANSHLFKLIFLLIHMHSYWFIKFLNQTIPFQMSVSTHLLFWYMDGHLIGKVFK